MNDRATGPRVTTGRKIFSPPQLSDRLLGLNQRTLGTQPQEREADHPRLSSAKSKNA